MNIDEMNIMFNYMKKAEILGTLPFDFIVSIGKTKEFVMYVNQKSQEPGADKWLKKVAVELEQILKA